MKNTIKFVISLTLCSSLLLTACHEGPAEKKGKSIDNAVENVKDKIENKGPAQKMGEKLDKATDN